MKKSKKKIDEQPQWLENQLHEQVLNYKVYEMSVKEKALYTVLSFLIGGSVGLVFYGGLFKRDGVATVATLISNGVVFLLCGVIAAKVFLPIRQQQLLKSRQADIRTQFRDMLESLTASLMAGNIVRDAFSGALSDMQNQYSDSAYIVNELNQIVQAARNNVDLSKMIDDFAQRSGVEDIEDFANVFSVAYGPGGSIADIMRQTHDLIGEKMVIEDEITSKMKSNELELNIIMIAPVFIVTFLRFGNGTFGEKFASPSGVLASTIGIALFIVAYKLGRKIISSAR